MARSKIDLTPHKEQIVGWRNDGWTRQEMIDELARQGTVVSTTCFERVLKQWVPNVNRTSIRSQPDGGAAMKAAIAHHFHVLRVNDEKSAELLVAAGFDTAVNTVRRIRRSMGLIKHHTPAQNKKIHDDLREILKRELQDEEVKNYGRRQMYAYMRSKYDFVVSRDGLAALTKELIPDVVAARSYKPPSRLGKKKAPPKSIAAPAPTLPATEYAAPPEVPSGPPDAGEALDGLGSSVDFGGHQLDPQLGQWDDSSRRAEAAQAIAQIAEQASLPLQPQPPLDLESAPPVQQQTLAEQPSPTVLHLQPDLAADDVLQDFQLAVERARNWTAYSRFGFNAFLASSAHKNRMRVKQDKAERILYFLTFPDAPPREDDPVDAQTKEQTPRHWMLVDGLLYRKATSPHPRRRHVPANQVFDIITAEHVRHKHLGRDELMKILELKYISMVKSEVTYVLDHCLLCSKDRTGQRAVRTRRRRKTP